MRVGAEDVESTVGVAVGVRGTASMRRRRGAGEGEGGGGLTSVGSSSLDEAVHAEDGAELSATMA